MMVDGRALLGFRATIKVNDILVDVKAKRSRCCRQNDEWLRNGSVNCATTTRSSSITEVSIHYRKNYECMLILGSAVSGGKSDRSMSPTTMSEDDRRELIARQHRALYGDTTSMYGSEGSGSRPQSQDVRSANPNRGPSPLAFDPYGVQAHQSAEGAVQMPPRDRGNSTASPVSQQTTQQSYTLLSDAQQSSRTSNSSPGESPPPGQNQKGAAPGVAPIGTRPTQAPGSAGGLNKRSTTPLTPSSLSYGFNADAQNIGANKDERSTSAASNPPPADKPVTGLGGWGSNSGVWGSGKNSLAVQPSVWG